MGFFNIFFKTLGILFGLTTFIIIINLLILFISSDSKNYEFVKGDRNSKNVIAIIELNGPILNNRSQSIVSNAFNYINPEKVREYLRNLEKYNPKILIIKINSPGGMVSATYSLENVILEFKKRNKTKIYFYSDEILASGGYWLATTGNKIFANYGSIIGSIGVSGPVWFYYDKPISISSGVFGPEIVTENGIKTYNQNAGNSKDLYNPFRKPTKEERSHLQKIVKEIYNDFIFKVSKSRKIDINTLTSEIGALIFTSTQAKNNYLIDDVLEYEEVLNRIINDNNFDNFNIIENKIRNSFLENYLSVLLRKNNLNICQKLNSNFVLIYPIYLINC